ncbi:MAG TPA: LCP family protein [Roseiflexaceae bacterium]|nr:LCP family protein [Roseiflexaceae bacterium]
MDCREARRLLDSGVTPGSQSPERAALGFHLAGCEACRRYRADREAHLLELLLARPAATSVQPSEPSPTAGRRERLAQTLWVAGMAVLGMLALIILVGTALAARSLFAIHNNVQAMIVPTTVPATALPTPTATELPDVTPTIALLVTPTSVATPTPKPTATPRATATPRPPAAGDPVTVLLLGSDRRPDEREPARTDAVMLMRIDPQRQRIALLSLPRDLMVAIPGYGWSRVNSANVIGYDGAEGGPVLAREAISRLVGIPIDYYVYVDFQGFIGAIDALGGVTVNVDRELYDNKFPTMDYGYSVAHFLPGPQRMDGVTALTYSRIRHPDSDFARIKRQQSVIIGILGQLQADHVLGTLQRLEEVSRALRDYVRTDMPEERILGLAWALRNHAPQEVERYTVEASMVAFGLGNDRWAETIEPDLVQGLGQKLVGKP